MIKNKFILFLLFIGTFHIAKAGNPPIQIVFQLNYGNELLQINETNSGFFDSNQINIEALKFYISKIQFLKKGKIVLVEANSYHLVDAASKNTLKILIDNNAKLDFDVLEFQLGIDSVTNVSGAMGGDLDPTKGMYWTWQSGYINFKLEGRSALCKTKNNAFQFHLGGYQRPNDALQKLTFPINNREAIFLRLDLKKLIQEIDLSKTNHIMSPSEEAVLISNKIAKAFSVK